MSGDLSFETTFVTYFNVDCTLTDLNVLYFDVP